MFIRWLLWKGGINLVVARHQLFEVNYIWIQIFDVKIALLTDIWRHLTLIFSTYENVWNDLICRFRIPRKIDIKSLGKPFDWPWLTIDKIIKYSSNILWICLYKQIVELCFVMCLYLSLPSSPHFIPLLLHFPLSLSHPL